MVARRSDWHCRLTYDQGVALQPGADGPRGRVEQPVIDVVIPVRQERNDQHHRAYTGYAARSVGGRAQPSRGDRLGDRLLEACLFSYVRASGVDRRDHVRIDVTADHRKASGCVLRCERQADLAQSDHRHP